MMENAPVAKEHPIINIEESAMPIESLVGQVTLIQNVMSRVMKKDEHYGVIPGTDKPTLLKPGAEKLCLTFRLDPDYEIIREVREKNFIAYTIKCSLAHIPTGNPIASGVGSCNSRETKYRYRSQNTGKPVPKEYWQDRDSEKLGGPQFSPRKKDKQWVIYEQIENENPWDLDNTLMKMACKRALIAATLNATAASDIFTQDIEDMPAEIITGEKKKEDPLENLQDFGEPDTDDDLPDHKPASQDEALQRQRRGELKTYAKKNNDAYFTTIGQHGASNAEEIVTTFNDEQYASLIKDLKKACK